MAANFRHFDPDTTKETILKGGVGEFLKVYYKSLYQKVFLYRNRNQLVME